MKGKAVVFTDRLEVAVREVDIPDPGAHDVVIDLDVSWISIGTEGSFLRGERIGGDTAYAPGAPWPFPIVAGYQKTGIVRQVGTGVSGLQEGDRVFATLSKVSGMFDPNGGHVSPAVTPADQVWKLPSGANPLDYCGTVLAQVGYNCGIRPPVEPGDRAVVIGDGLVGHWAAQTLLQRKAEVLVIGRHDRRLAMLPAGVARFNANAGAEPEAVRQFAGGDELSIVVDTVGDLPAVERMFPLLRRDSHFVSAGFYGGAGNLDIQKLRNQEITLHAPSGWTRKRMDATLAGIRDGWLKTGELVTHRFPVERADEAWRLINDKNVFKLGVVLDW